MRSRFLFICFFQKKVFFPTEISLYKVLRSATVSRSRHFLFDKIRPFGIPTQWVNALLATQWEMEPAMEGWQLASGRCLNDCWEGLQSAFMKPHQSPHDQLEDSHHNFVLKWRKLKFQAWKIHQNSGSPISPRSLRSLPLVAVPFIAGNAPQLLGRATEVLRELRQKNVWPSHDWRINLSKKRVFLPKSGDHQLIW